MFRATAVMALLACAAVAVAQGPSVISQKGQDRFETEFSPGKLLQLEVRSGDVRIFGSESNKVTIHYEGRNSAEVDDVRVYFQRSAGGGELRIAGGPRNEFQIRIEVPRTTDLHVRMPFGQLEIEDIRGSKDVEVHAGQVTIGMGDPKEYAEIEASVTTGEVDAAPFAVNKGGLFRSFRQAGPGKYRLHAHIGSGQLILR